jgi:hypothetical protein
MARIWWLSGKAQGGESSLGQIRVRRPHHNVKKSFALYVFVKFIKYFFLNLNAGVKISIAERVTQAWTGAKKKIQKRKFSPSPEVSWNLQKKGTCKIAH